MINVEFKYISYIKIKINNRDALLYPSSNATWIHLDNIPIKYVILKYFDSAIPYSWLIMARIVLLCIYNI